jgi:hypothetical protein
VTLDGVADDGRPGEGDNVVGVERFTARAGGTFVGSDAAEVFDVPANVSQSDSTIRGMGGNDVIKAYRYADTVDGGPGDDKVEGGLNNDVVIGGRGRDQLFGDSTGSHCNLYECIVPFGNDVIEARDGEADQVDCGVGEDVARVDALDTVSPNCETVERGAASAGGTGATSKPGAAAVALAGTRSVRGLLAGRLRVRVPCAAACTVTAAVKAARRTVASGRATAPAAGTAEIKLRVAATARRSLRRARKLSGTLSITVKSASGSANQSRKLALKR